MGVFLENRWFAPTVAAVSTTWAMTIGATPVMADTSRAGAVAASLAYLAGSVICHQRPERSFHLGAAQLPVCARCTGLYVGGALGAVAWLVWRHARPLAARTIERKRAVAVLVIASAPTLFTVLTAVGGIWDLSNAGRAMLALPLGFAAGAIVTAVASNDLS